LDTSRNEISLLKKKLNFVENEIGKLKLLDIENKNFIDKSISGIIKKDDVQEIVLKINYNMLDSIFNRLSMEPRDGYSLNQQL
jgi:hypothetical protein